ncbi:MAG: anti-sigma factor antagonist [Defluviitaleaceae bacterium]|nr:anti-sigma factor antagonist [Defluviitaleaceae bacterium]MCL2238996.1 anti-sigma factor antagonist [Defluviitaleaceae bacterium]
MLHIDTQGKVMLVSPSVEIDAHSAERLRSAIDAAFEKSACMYMVFDFSQVRFMDSSGIGMLIGRYKQAEKRGGALALANMGDEMNRLYTISGLAKIIKSFPTTQDALATFVGNPAQGGMKHANA